jgi:SNF2 family DNA or RNA helicase
MDSTCDDFAKNEDIPVLFMTSSGLEGINLTCASAVIFLGPLWNPVKERQGFSRVRRIGQKRDVKIYHLYCPDSVHAFVLGVQAIKRYKEQGLSSKKNMKWNREEVENAVKVLWPVSKSDKEASTSDKQ